MNNNDIVQKLWNLCDVCATMASTTATTLLNSAIYADAQTRLHEPRKYGLRVQ